MIFADQNDNSSCCASNNMALSLEAAQQSISALDKANRDLIEALESSQAHEERNQSKIRDLTKKLSASETIIADLQNQLAMSCRHERKFSMGTVGTDSEEKDEVDNNEIDDRASEKSRDDFVSIVATLRRELADREEDARNMRCVVDAQNGMLKFAETELADMKIKMSAQIERSLSHEDELEHLRLNPHGIQKGSTVENIELQEMNEGLSKKVSELLNQLTMSEKLKSDKETHLNKALEAIAALKQDIKDLSEENEMLRNQQNDPLVNENEERIRAWSDEIVKLRNSQEQHEVAFEELGSLRSDVKHLKEQLSLSKKALSKAEVDNYEKQNQIIRLEKTIGNLRVENAEHIHELEMMHKDNSVHSRSLSGSVDYTDYSNVSSIIEQNEIAHTIMLRDQNKRLEEELKRSNSSCEELSREISKLWEMLNISEKSRVESDSNLMNAHQKMSTIIKNSPHNRSSE